MNPTVLHLIQSALDEDIGPGDVTTDNLVDPDRMGVGIIITKEPLVLAGVALARDLISVLDPEVRARPFHEDGHWVDKGEIVVEFQGSLQALLKGERTALNFMQRLSGIATQVRSYVNEVKDKPVQLVDTRKTTPGLRFLEKYAVRMGGAHNHRMGLYDGILIKDNHIQICGGVLQAVTRMKKKVPHLLKIEVEVADIEQAKEAVAAGADVIMLDNMTIPEMEEAIAVVDKRALVEVSGNISQSKLKQLADLGVDLISIGALTHSARSVDLSMDIKPSG
jgi:nicotinate-nucleotide pyrophosphorylase (carboxylating)